MAFGFQIQNLALFLSLCESFHPTRFRQRCGGFIPMVLSPIGFLRFRFRYETVRFLSRNIYELAFSNSKKRFQTRIWDPGGNDSDCTEHRIKNRFCPDLTPSTSDEEESRRWPIDFPEWVFVYLSSQTVYVDVISDLRRRVQSKPNCYCPSHNCLFIRCCRPSMMLQTIDGDTLSFSWSKNSNSLAIGVGFYLVKVQIPSDDDGDVYRSWAITFSSLDMIHRFSQSHVIFIHLFCLWYKHEARHEPLVSRDWLYCFARVNRIQKMCGCLILYSSEIHRCSSGFHQGNILFNILFSMLWWHWGHSSWQQWVTERLPHKLSECLPESSNILMSTKRQDPGSSPTTLSSHFKSKVMLQAFWSLSSKLIANNKYVKEGHNRFHLLARKAFDSRVTLHSFIEIVSISYICVQWLFCIYLVPCKLL